MADSKKGHFSKSPILNIFLWKIHELVLGLVEFIDAKGIGMAQPIWPWGCRTLALKQAKNAFLVFLGCFWAFVRQPHNYIGWARPMPFTSINSTNSRTNPWNVHENILRIKGVENLRFFESAILNFFFQKKKFYFVPMKISHKLCDRMDGTQFWCFPWLSANSLLCVILRYTMYL